MESWAKNIHNNQSYILRLVNVNQKIEDMEFKVPKNWVSSQIKSFYLQFHSKNDEKIFEKNIKLIYAGKELQEDTPFENLIDKEEYIEKGFCKIYIMSSNEKSEKNVENQSEGDKKTKTALFSFLQCVQDLKLLNDLLKLVLQNSHRNRNGIDDKNKRDIFEILPLREESFQRLMRRASKVDIQEFIEDEDDQIALKDFFKIFGLKTKKRSILLGSQTAIIMDQNSIIVIFIIR